MQLIWDISENDDNSTFVQIVIHHLILIRNLYVAQHIMRLLRKKPVIPVAAQTETNQAALICAATLFHAEAAGFGTVGLKTVSSTDHVTAVNGIL